MTFLPIVARELRVASRRRSTYRGRLGAAIISIAITAFWLPVMASQLATSQGKGLFRALATLSFAYCLFAGARATSDCLSAEKREGTIGLLFLTDLKGYDVVLGKLVSSSVGVFYGLLGTVPVLSLALLLGGVTPGEVGRMALLFLNTLLFSLSAGVLVSTLSRNDRRAMFATVFVIILIAGGPFTIASIDMFRQMQTNGNPSLAQYTPLLTPSPAFAFYLLGSGYTGRLLLQDFHHSILVTAGLSLSFLALASLAVVRVCRERPAGRLGTRWLNFRNRWSYGRPARRRALGRPLLDRNAFFWLAGRDRAKRWYAWFFTTTVILMWCCAGWQLEGFMFDWDASFWLLLVIFLFFKIWMTSEICSRLVEDRAAGAFELVLSSPMQAKDVARGQSMALWRQFGWPALLILALTWALATFAIRPTSDHPSTGEVKLMFWALMLMAMADLAAIKWVASWEAIKSTQIHRAAMAVCGRVLLLPTVLFVVIYSFGMMLLQDSDPNLVTASNWGFGALLWLAIGLATDVWFGVSARWRFLHHFREAATGRFVPRGSRLEPFREILRAVRKRLGRRPQAAMMGPARAGRRWLILGPALVLAAGLVVYLSWKHALRQSIEAKLATIKAAGQPLTIPDLDGWGPVVRDSENAAVLLQEAESRVVWQPRAAKGAPVIKLDWPGAAGALTPQAQLNISNWVSQNQIALELVHDAARLPSSRYHIYWRGTMRDVAPWQTLARVRVFADLVQFEGLLRSDSGDVEAALESVRTLFGLARALGQEPSVAGQQHRRSFLLAALRCCERILGRHRLSAGQLDSLRQQLYQAETATPQSLFRSFVGERCIGMDDFRSGRLQGAWGGPPPSGFESFRLGVIDLGGRISGVRERRWLEYLAIMDECIEDAAHLASPSPRILAMPTTLNPQFQLGTREQLAAAQDYWRSVTVRQLELIAHLRAARAAVAIEQFRRLNEDRLPQNLQQLSAVAAAGPFLSPARQDGLTDPFGAGPLIYVRTEPGYTLYSVGPDKQDNAGLAEANPSRMAPSPHYDITFRVGR